MALGGVFLHWFVYLDYLRDIESGAAMDPEDPRRITMVILDAVSMLGSFALIVRLLTNPNASKQPALEMFLNMVILALVAIRWQWLLNPDPASSVLDYSKVLSVISISFAALLSVIMFLALVGVVVLPTKELFA